MTSNMNFKLTKEQCLVLFRILSTLTAMKSQGERFATRDPLSVESMKSMFFNTRDVDLARLPKHAVTRPGYICDNSCQKIHNCHDLKWLDWGTNTPKTVSRYDKHFSSYKKFKDILMPQLSHQRQIVPPK